MGSTPARGRTRTRRTTRAVMPNFLSPIKRCLAPSSTQSVNRGEEPLTLTIPSSDCNVLSAYSTLQRWVLNMSSAHYPAQNICEPKTFRSLEPDTLLHKTFFR
jgi:hypothetical protein